MKIAVIVPNWNGADFIQTCIDSLLAQTIPCEVVVVDNGSIDASIDILESYGESITTILLDKNYGFTGGVNAGISYAINKDFDGVALLNNDAAVEQNWLEELSSRLRDRIGICTSLVLSMDGRTIDTTGDMMTIWGLPYPRGRGQDFDKSEYKSDEFVFGASGGASLYSVPMLKEIGLFDQDFFAYYEDADISWRAQIAGWKVLFTPRAVAFHRIGATSSRLKGFTSYHTFKNLRLLVSKNTPKGLRHVIYPRFYFAYNLFQIKALLSRNALPMIRGSFMGIVIIIKRGVTGRLKGQAQEVDNDYLLSIMEKDPPESSTMRKLISYFKDN